MRTGLVLIVIMVVAVTVMAQDLGTSREPPVKNTPIVTYEPPAVPRQGGDTIEDATVIPSLPYSTTGTTAGFINDYDEICPYSGSLSPEVVYSFTPAFDIQVDVDLCGSLYDTKTYIYDSGLHLIACNDDFYFDESCGMYRSKIEQAPLFEGNTYYIVIDGYGGDSGDYVLNILGIDPCYVYCPDDAVPEGEPPLHDGYVDAFNGGCDHGAYEPPFQPIDWTNDADGLPPYDGTAWMCGKSGWYLHSSGSHRRDKDWFRIYALETGVMEFTLEAEYRCSIEIIAPLDCVPIRVYTEATTDCEAPAVLSYPVDAGEEVWLRVKPPAATGLVTEFTYFLTVTNNTFDTVPAEGMSWGGVKSLYR